MCNVYNIGDNKKSLVMSVYCTACVALRVRCTSFFGGWAYYSPYSEAPALLAPIRQIRQIRQLRHLLILLLTPHLS